MSKHYPPEGRRERHNKPMIPQSQKSQRKHEGESSIPGPVEGTLLSRKLLFRCDTTRSGWAFDMLIAIAAAKQMGATTFEIAVDGEPNRPVQRREVSLFFGGGPSEEPWQRTATETGTCTISIYALVVE